MGFSKQALILILVFGALMSRFLPHPPNMTALGAAALFSGHFLRPRALALMIPVLIMLISDFFLGFHPLMAFVYGAWILIGILAMTLMKDAKTWRLMGWASLSTAIFFIVTNFGVWWMQDLYPKNAQGLILCYTMALPFVGAQWVGDMLFSGLLFSIWALLEKKLFSAQAPAHR